MVVCASPKLFGRASAVLPVAERINVTLPRARFPDSEAEQAARSGHEIDWSVPDEPLNGGRPGGVHAGVALASDKGFMANHVIIRVNDYVATIRANVGLFGATPERKV